MATETEVKLKNAKSSNWKFPYQLQEIAFLDEYYSPYFRFRGMTKNERIYLVSGYIKNILINMDATNYNYNDIEESIIQIMFISNDENDDLYKTQCLKLIDKFKKIKQDYFASLPPKPKKTDDEELLQKRTKTKTIPKKTDKKSTYSAKKGRKKKGKKRREMTEEEKENEEYALIEDNKHVFKNGFDAEGYFNYELDLDENINLVPSGECMLIAPNKIEYILPGDTVYLYVLNGSYRRPRPWYRWYFWTNIEWDTSIEELVYKRHGLDWEPTKDDD